MSGDDPAAACIEAVLAAVEAEEGVRIVFAVEAGSRAWGFPSPGSDHDVRCVYAHPLDWYVSVLPRRDVVERLSRLPIGSGRPDPSRIAPDSEPTAPSAARADPDRADRAEGEGLDLVGWDARKALGLLLKPNPVLLEWLSSPIRYRWSEGACAAMADLARRAAPGAACVHYYHRLCDKVFRGEIAGRENVAPKHYLYAVRAALALRRVRLECGDAPPMNLAALLHGAALPAGVDREIAALVSLKRAGAGDGGRYPRLDALVEEELAAATVPEARRREDLSDDADHLLRRIVRGELA